MRGRKDEQARLFDSIRIEERIRPDHPLRPIKTRVDAILRELNPLFAVAYSTTGRPGVPPERLLKALLLMSLFSVRSERQLVERIDTDLLFRWFLDMDPEEPVFDSTAFTHNRPRLDEHGLTAVFFEAVVKQAIEAGLVSTEHFRVDGTLIESYASMKSFQPRQDDEDDSEQPDGNSFKPSNPDVDFKGQKRSNATHCSRTDPEAKLYRKGRGQESKLAHFGHALAENRHGLVVAIEVSEASGTAERTAALNLLDQASKLEGVKVCTLGADKGYDSGPFCLDLESRNVEPHVALVSTQPPNPENVRKHRRPAVAARERMKERLATTAYQASQKARRKIEECFGWMKSIGGLTRSRFVGRWKLKQQAEITAAAFNLVRMRRLIPQT